MQLLISATVFLFAYNLMASLGSKSQPVKVDIRGRLGQVMHAEEVRDARQKELSKPLAERLLIPLVGKTSSLVAKMLPTGMLKSLEPKVVRAGNPGGLSVNEYLGIKGMLAAILPALCYWLSQGGLGGPARQVFILAVVAAVGWKLPDIYLQKIAADKAKTMEKTFPDILDLLCVSVEAGLGFDGAMVKVVEKDSGLVAEEFRRILHEIKMGKSRRDALRDFARRTAVSDINTFVNAIVQSEQLGLSISNTLRSQSEQMRRKRRQRVEEQAMKAPVKMLIPLIIFIFPTIFLILLGPALIQIVEGFAK